MAPRLIHKTRLFAWLSLGWALLILYGNLLPFAYNGLSLEQGWERFMHPGSGLADLDGTGWFLEGLAYLCLGFAAAGWWAGGNPYGRRPVWREWPALAGCLGLALVSGFLQVFFSGPGATLVDLSGALLGSLLGILAWAHGRVWLVALWHDLQAGGATAMRAAGLVYALLYLGLALFPFDVIPSTEGLRLKWASDEVGPWLAGAACADPLRCLLRLLLEVLTLVPLGLILGISPIRTRVGYLLIPLLGLLLGLGLELLQALLRSGISQGLSVLTPALGLSAGFWLFRNLQPRHVWTLLPYSRTAMALLAPLYLMLVLAANGWFAGQWGGLEQALDQLAGTSFWPFYYHFTASESVAGFSILANGALYGLIGLGGWLWSQGRPQPLAPRRLAGLALGLATLVEAGKPWQLDRHPDPSNLLIAALAALGGFLVTDWLARQWRAQVTTRSPRTAGTKPVPPPGSEPEPVMEPPPEPPHDAGPELPTLAPEPGMTPIPDPVQWPPRSAPAPRPFQMTSPHGHPLSRGLALLLGLGLLLMLWRYPLGRGALALSLCAYGALLWHYPRAWLLVIPALLPTLDLAASSGRFYWEGLDFFLAATLAMALWRGLPGPGGPETRGVSALAILLGLGGLLALGIGLVPLDPLDANAFAHYGSHYNALREAKGLLWALLLLPLLREALRDPDTSTRYLLPGLALGFAGATLGILGERLAFGDPFDLAQGFRVTAGFSSMHTGGAHLGAYLVLLTPPLLIAPLLYWGWRRRLPALVVWPLGLYGLLASLNRDGLLVLTLGLGVLALALMVAASQRWPRQHRARRLLAGGILGLLMLGALLPLLRSELLVTRLEQVGQDLATRLEQGREALGLMDREASRVLFGMGLGRFPDQFQLRQPLERLPAGFQFVKESDTTYLRLTGGHGLLYEQRVHLDSQGGPQGPYHLRMDLRLSTPAARLLILVCAKAMFYAQDCRWLTTTPLPADGQWHGVDLEFEAAGLGTGPWHGRPPIKLSLANRIPGQVVEVDNLGLWGPDGANRIRNGDFSRGQDYWYFTSDDRRPWQAGQLWAQVLFTQGLLGLALFSLFSLLALTRLVFQIRRGDLLASGLLAGLIGFLGMGLFDALLDAPRLAFLYYLLAFTALLLPRPSRPNPMPPPAI